MAVALVVAGWVWAAATGRVAAGWLLVPLLLLIQVVLDLPGQRPRVTAPGAVARAVPAGQGATT